MSNYVLNNGSIKGDMSFDNVLQFSFRYFLQYLMEISYCGSKVYPRGFTVGLILVNSKGGFDLFHVVCGFIIIDFQGLSESVIHVH